jgi:hypothetical protein
MNLKNLKSLFTNNGCQKIYVKKLAPNDNSKNQVYFGGSFEILNILPIKDITTEAAGDWKKERFKAILDFSWIGENGNLFSAPKSQLILYPKYPEVRFSGFLSHCENAPSELMNQRLQNRVLFFSVAQTGKIIGYVVGPDSVIANELNQERDLSEHGVFKIIELRSVKNNKEKLFSELLRIHELGWIQSKRLNSQGKIMPCNSTNCGGYTLEAELGVNPNGYSEPDYLGWEIKQFGVKNFNRIDSAIITLMTPEPTGGFYHEKGSESFIRRYGYNDLMGRPDRMNFGGIHKIGEKHVRTNLNMMLIGFDDESGKIRNSNGQIALIDTDNNIAASWNFSSLILHWNRKHNQACYVPSMIDKTENQKYQYGNKLIIGEGADFQLFLKEMTLGHIYYDPGIKLESASKAPKGKNRSQFRIKSKYLKDLYLHNEIVVL